MQPSLFTSSGENCSICRGPMHPNLNKESTLACKHCFHEDCIILWSDITNKCPICKARFNYIQTGNLKIKVLAKEQRHAEDDEGIAQELAEALCQICGTVCRELTLLCDGCDCYFHANCVGLMGLPDGQWFCHDETCQHLQTAMMISTHDLDEEWRPEQSMDYDEDQDYQDQDRASPRPIRNSRKRKQWDIESDDNKSPSPKRRRLQTENDRDSDIEILSSSGTAICAEWNCHMCTMINKAAMDKCQMCNTMKQATSDKEDTEWNGDMEEESEAGEEAQYDPFAKSHEDPIADEFDADEYDPFKL